MVVHDEDQYEHVQVWRPSGSPTTSVVSEEIWFRGEVKWPFLDKRCPGEVSNHKKWMDTHLRAQWEISNGADGSSNWAIFWSQRVKEEIKGFSFNKEFSLQIHSFACVAVVKVERREGPKSCGDRSGQTGCWNRDPSVGGKRPNPILSFWWIKSLV